MSQIIPSLCRAQLRGFLAVASLLVFLAATSGCNTLQFNPGTDPVEPNAETTGQQYQIQLIPQFGRDTVSQHAIEPGMTVQSALENSGAIDRFRAMEITLSRLVKDSGRVLRMPVSYDVRSQSVIPSQDYALHPGDTISVKAVTAGSFDKLIDSVTGGAL